MCDGTARDAEDGEQGLAQAGATSNAPLWRKLIRAGALAAMFAAVLCGGRAHAFSRPFDEPVVASSSQGRTAETIFSQLTQINGLPSPVVSAFTQDAEGFLWIGTQSGVSRWDGYHFRVYQAQLGAAGTIPDNLIQALYTDSDGTVWVGANTGGLARYDREHDNFVMYTKEFSRHGYGSISQITGDGAKGLWLGTEGGLVHFDVAAGQATPVAMGVDSRSAKGTQQSDRVLSLLCEADGRLLVGTEAGLFESDARVSRFTERMLPKERSTAVVSLFRDSDGRLWVGTRRGAFYFEHGWERGSVTARAVEDRSPGAATIDEESVVSIVESRPGVIWLATYGQGIISVHTNNFEMHRVVHSVSLPTSLADDWVQSMYLDRAGTVWAATRRGVSRSDRTRAGVWTYFGSLGGITGIEESDIFSVLPAKDGLLWLGLGRHGVELFEQGRRMGMLAADPAHPKTALPKGVIQKLLEMPDQSVYIASPAGLYKAGEKGKGLARVETAGGEYPSVNTLLHDKLAGTNGTLWAGCADGLWSLDLGPGQHLLSRVELRGELTDRRISSVLRGSNNDLWLGTQNGLNHVDLATMKVERTEPDAASPTGLGAGLISSMLYDRQGRLWVATFGGGIDVLEGRDAGGRLRFRRLLKGLPNTNVNTLLEAADGAIWASTDDGLAVVDPVTYAIRVMQAADGVVIPAYWTASGAVAADGRLIFGGLGGMTMVQPKKVKTWTYLPPIVVTDVRIGGKKVPVGRLNEADGGEPLRLGPGSDNLTVEFSALDYTAPELNQYAYKLDGFDRDWVVTDPTRRLASYTNLPPGNYTLELRGSNRAGVWSPTRVVGLRVMPAWYQTLWFRILMALAGVLVLGGVFQAGTAYLRARQRELERQVALRTAELEKMTTELQQSQQQLEQMAYSDSLTGLPNRRMFTEYFRRLLALKRRQRGSFVLMVIDMDDFKDVNDTHGHDAGDALLKEVGARLGRIVRESDCFARLGGDEFAMLLAESSDLAGIAHVCGLIEESFRDPVVFHEVRMRPKLSIGVAFYPDAGETQDSLFKSADLALYEVKRGGGNGWRVQGGVPDGSARAMDEIELPLAPGD